MHTEITDIHLAACELTEEFLGRVPKQLTLQAKRDIRLQALPLIQQYLYNDVACGLSASVFLFRTALNEDTAFANKISNFDCKKYAKEFSERPQFVEFANSLQGPNGADLETEFKAHLGKYVDDLRNNDPQKHNLFNNGLTHEQDYSNHAILTQAAQIVFDHIVLSFAHPIAPLTSVLNHAVACQQQLNPSISVTAPTTEQWVAVQRGETSPPARLVHR